MSACPNRNNSNIKPAAQFSQATQPNQANATGSCCNASPSSNSGFQMIEPKKDKHDKLIQQRKNEENMYNRFLEENTIREVHINERLGGKLYP